MGDEATIFTIQWGDTLTHLSQQMKHLLEGTTLVKSGVVGKQTTMEQMAARNFTKVTQRHKPITPSDPDLRRRWITMFDYTDAALFDKQDEMKTAITDVKGSLNQGLMMGANRLKDQVIIDAFSASARTGEDGSGTQAATAAIANGGTGLTLTKLRTINKTFLDNKVDEADPKYMIISPADHDDLLNISQIQSKDFNEGKAVMVDGRVKRFMGLDFIISTLLTTASGVTSCFAWAKSGMGVAYALEWALTTSQRNDLTKAPWQAEASVSVGATRLEEAKVVACDTYHA